MQAPSEQATGAGCGPAENPYVGPVPFTKGQTLYGREADVQVLVDLVVAKRIVLLISPSGAGKTSMIQAALIPQIEKRFNVLPVVRLDAMPREGSPHCNPYVYATLQILEKRLEPAQRRPPQVLETMDLAGYFRTLPTLLDARGRTRFPLVIFDQFEELFTLNRSDWALKKDFIRQVGELLGGADADDRDEADESPPEGVASSENADPDAPETSATNKPANMPPVWAVFSMREDHVAELEPYLYRIPTGLAFRQRLLPLEIDQAMQAISGPAPSDFPEASAKALVDDLRRVKQAGPVANADAGFMGRFVEPLLLQVGCRRLWDQVVAGQGRPIAPSDIVSNQSTSQVDAALADYVSEEISAAGKLAKGTSRFLRDFLEDRLLSRNGVRTKVLRDPLQLGELEPALNQLIERHILRADIAGDREWIELSHDRLIAPLYQGNRRWREEHLSLMQKQAKLWDEAGRPEDMLFTDVQLEHGEAFAREHPEFIGELDLKFLAESRQKRAQVLVEQARTQVIAQKNQQLKMQLRIMLASSVLLVGVALWLNHAIGQSKLERAKAETAQRKSYQDFLDSRLKEAALLVRDDNSTAGLKLLIATQEAIAQQNFDGLNAAVDTTLIRVLGRYPPVERRLGEHQAGVRSLAFADGGELVLSASLDKTLGFWASAGNRTLGRSPGGHALGVTSVAYSGAGGATGVAVSGDEGGDIVLWEVKPDSLRKISDIRWRNEIADGLAVPGDPQDPSVPQITSLALNRQGTILAAASRQKRIAFWDISDRAKPRPLFSVGSLVHQSDIFHIGFLPDGAAKGEVNGAADDRLVSADTGGRVALWNPRIAASGKPETTFMAQDKPSLQALALSPDGRWIIAGDASGDLHVWSARAQGVDVPAAKVLNKQSRGRINGLAFSNDGKNLFSVGEDKSLIRWTFPGKVAEASDFRSATTRASRIPGWDEKLYAVAVHPKREGVVVIGGAKGVVLVDTEQRSPLAKPIGVDGVAASSWLGLRGSAKLDALMALESDQRTVQLMRETGGQYVRSGAAWVADEDVRAMAMSRDGADLAIQACSGRVKLGPPADLAKLAWLTEGAAGGPSESCTPRNTMAFAPDGKTLLAARGADLLVWTKAANGAWQGPVKTTLGQVVASVAIDTKGELVALGTGQNTLEVRRLAAGKLADQPIAEARGRLASPVIALAFNADGSRVIVSTENPNDVSTWEFKVETSRTSFSEQHDHAVDQIATGMREGTQAQFSADRNGQVVACFGPLDSSNCTRLGRSFGRPITGLVMNEDASRLVIAGPGLYRWELGRASMLATATRLANEGR